MAFQITPRNKMMNRNALVSVFFILEIAWQTLQNGGEMAKNSTKLESITNTHEKHLQFLNEKQIFSILCWFALFQLPSSACVNRYSDFWKIASHWVF